MRANLLIPMMCAMVAGAMAQEGPAEALWDLYQEGRFAEVVEQGKALLNTGTETAQVNLAVGRALADDGSPSEAEIFLARAVELDPERTWVYAWAQVYLGNTRWGAGDEEAARRHWILARDAAATANATRAARMNLLGFGLDESFEEWTTFTSDHFVFRFSPALADRDHAAHARRHEEARAVIAAWFGGGPEEPTLYIVWADQDEASAAGMPSLGFAKPDLNLVHCRVGQTVGHEMTHVISWHALQPTVRTGLVNEGTAVHFDQTGRDQLARARTALAEARTPAGRLLPPVALAALWEDPSLVPSEVLYPLAGAWIGRLIERGGREKYLEFFPDQSLAHAREVYGDGLSGWMAEFERDLEK